MLFLEYEDLLARYRRAREIFEAVLKEEEELFAKALPSGVKYDTQKVSGGDPGDPFTEYLIQKERLKIDERLEEANRLVDERQKAMRLKERELRKSDGLYDTVYRCRYIDHSKVKKISKIIGYSLAQTYRVIERVDELIKMRKNENLHVL